MDDFLGTFMGRNARAKVLRAFAFDTGVFTAGQVAKRASVSAITAAAEILILEKWKVLKRAKLVLAVGERRISGKQKMPAWTLNPDFKYASAITKFVHEVSPVHHKSVISGLRKGCRPTVVILSGSFIGDSGRPADMVVVGDILNERRLDSAVRGLERIFGREIRYVALSTPEFRYRMTIHDRLLREILDYPHLVLLDKTRLL